MEFLGGGSVAELVSTHTHTHTHIHTQSSIIVAAVINSRILPKIKSYGIVGGHGLGGVKLSSHQLLAYHIKERNCYRHGRIPN